MRHKKRLDIISNSCKMQNGTDDEIKNCKPSYRKIELAVFSMLYLIGIKEYRKRGEHRVASAEECGTRSWRNFDSPSIQIDPISMHHPRYSMSNLV